MSEFGPDHTAVSKQIAPRRLHAMRGITPQRRAFTAGTPATNAAPLTTSNAASR